MLRRLCSVLWQFHTVLVAHSGYRSKVSGHRMSSYCNACFPFLCWRNCVFALRIPIEDLDEREADQAFVRQVGKTVEQSFLGVLGVFAFCQRMELFCGPGNFYGQALCRVVANSLVGGGGRFHGDGAHVMSLSSVFNNKKLLLFFFWRRCFFSTLFLTMKALHGNTWQLRRHEMLGTACAKNGIKRGVQCGLNVLFLLSSVFAHLFLHLFFFSFLPPFPLFHWLYYENSVVGDR
ncbi:hypothetical protein C3747_14g84 [Trypanosoma cruzi]|uniref:Uncharacterized protein n=1 Tax=Trypanosoma cruzi TaxID=5693 RepID=A0A2V2XDK2_TRYCR|nr:hypothetical protein C3747_14g84 [Trypanosoma cruzi]